MTYAEDWGLPYHRIGGSHSVQVNCTESQSPVSPMPLQAVVNAFEAKHDKYTTVRSIGGTRHPIAFKTTIYTSVGHESYSRDIFATFSFAKRIVLGSS